MKRMLRRQRNGCHVICGGSYLPFMPLVCCEPEERRHITHRKGTKK